MNESSGAKQEAELGPFGQTDAAAAGPSSSSEHLVQVDPEDPRLELSVATYSFQVRREHHNQLLACQAQHAAYQLEGRAPEVRALLLEVHFEPELELVRDQSPLVEGSAARMSYRAEARPQAHTFEWFLDGQLIEGAQEAELLFARLTRQLHQRQLKCCATNSLGRQCASQPLNVTYAPAYVTHLLPGSLQPAGEQFGDQEAEAEVEAEVEGAERLLQRQPQLARLVRAGSDVSLRCDFDANPRPLQVDWFRLDTGWPLMRDVDSAEADELIARGALHATFSQPPASLAPIEQQASKHSAPGKQAAAKAQLDLEQMATELLAELQQAEELRRRLGGLGANLTSEEREALELVRQVVTEPYLYTQANISEPLGWEMRSSRRRANPRRLLLKTGHHQPTLASQAAAPLAQEKELALLAPLGSDERAPLRWRRAELASSSIVLRRVNEDSAGKYVCRARGPANSTRWSARAIQLVLRQSPRIVSVRDQWAQLGARQLQLECLVQLNGASNGTRFQWFRAQQSAAGLEQKVSHLLQLSLSLSSAHSIPTLSPSHQLTNCRRAHETAN